MMKKYAFLILSGVLLLGTGVALLKLISEPQGILLTLPYVCIGFGCGLFGHGLGDFPNQRAIKSSPKLQKQQRIAENDERNIAISNCAKGKAYDIMVYVFGALMAAFALMGVDLAVILLLVFAYWVVIGFHIYYLNKFNKEM